jgi:hypothetical protein
VRVTVSNREDNIKPVKEPKMKRHVVLSKGRKIMHAMITVILIAEVNE